MSTDVGGVADVVTHGVTGLLAPMDDEAALAAHVVSILADPDGAREMGQRGRRHVVPIYSAERLVSDIERLYLSLLQQKGVLTPSRVTPE